MNGNALLVAGAVGLILQVAMVIGGHYSPAIQAWFAAGGMGFSLVAGFLFAYLAKAGWKSDLGGGAVVGGGCALVGIGISCALGDVPATLLLLGTFSSIVTGSIGGAIGKLLLE